MALNMPAVAYMKVGHLANQMNPWNRKGIIKHTFFKNTSNLETINES